MVSDKNNAFGGEKQNKKGNSEQSDLCDLEQVTLKPQLQVQHCLTIWLQIWYHSLLWADSIRKGANLEKQNCLSASIPRNWGNKLSASSLPIFSLWMYFTFIVYNKSKCFWKNVLLFPTLHPKLLDKT